MQCVGPEHGSSRSACQSLHPVTATLYYTSLNMESHFLHSLNKLNCGFSLLCDCFSALVRFTHLRWTLSPAFPSDHSHLILCYRPWKILPPSPQVTNNAGTHHAEQRRQVGVSIMFCNRSVNIGIDVIEKVHCKLKETFLFDSTFKGQVWKIDSESTRETDSPHANNRPVKAVKSFVLEAMQASLTTTSGQRPFPAPPKKK